MGNELSQMMHCGKNLEVTISANRAELAVTREI